MGTVGSNVDSAVSKMEDQLKLWSAKLNEAAIVNVIGEDGDWWHVEVHGYVAKTQVGPSLDPPKK